MSNKKNSINKRSNNNVSISVRDVLPPLRQTSQCPSASNWRRDAYFVLPKRSTTTKLHEHVTELALNNKRKFLNLKEILSVIQEVWKPRKNNYTKIFKKMNNDSDSKYSNCNSSRDMPSPILIRRRLSAPETIMRKHVLAQQRANLHDDVKYETNISNDNTELSGGSYPNLSRRKDCDYMRKSTLLRRLWSNNKLTFGSKYVNSYYEWQHLFGKSTNSLYSNHSSSEQLYKTNSRKTSPQHKQSNYKKLLTTGSGGCKSKQNLNEYSVYSKYNFDNNQYSSNPNLISHKTSTTLSPKTISSDDNIDSSRKSTFTPSTDNSLNGNNNKIDIDSSLQSNESLNYFSRRISDTSTQTADVTNLNVISNVKLSDATLDLIFNRVMDDVHKSIQSNTNTQSSFYLSSQNNDENTAENSKIVKCMIGTGSPYSKPQEVPQIVVPRYSALPRTTSMEVNISSGDSDEKDDDSLSFVDSLEDINSPRLKQSDNLSPLLPDNSERKKIKDEKRSASFFIPIENENGTNNIKQSALTELLPGKVKEKLVKRQQIRTEKQNNNKFKCIDNASNNNYEQYRFVVDTNDNLSVSLPKINSKQKKKIKPVLPKLKTIRRIKEQEQNDNQATKDVKRKCLRENNKTSNWILKDKLSPISTTSEQSFTIKNKSGNKNNSNKRIEILEVMECVDSNSEHTDISINKSKIPVLISKKSIKTNNIQKPTYLDNDNVEIIDDSKLDQLIANILIDTLNNTPDEPQTIKLKNEQKFDIIPEEPSSTDKSNSNNIEKSNININNNNNESSTSGLMDKSKINKPGGGVLNQNDSTIPSGWITFYLLHKHDMSPDSTSDEGKKLEQFKQIETENLQIEKNNIEKKTETVLPPINYKNSASVGNVNPFTGEWSVTLTASNIQQQIVPNIEMKLKFSQNNLKINNNSDSGIGDDTSNKKYANMTKNLLPLIHQNKCLIKRKRYNYLEPIKLYGPKQTRTSTSRYFLSRSNIYQFSPADLNNLMNKK